MQLELTKFRGSSYTCDTKPAGQVNEQIWSNSKFKLCLKVQTQEDSNEVLKSPLAAEIREPGRAYLQVGNNEMFELLQSGYSGSPEKVIWEIKSPLIFMNWISKGIENLFIDRDRRRQKAPVHS